VRLRECHPRHLVTGGRNSKRKPQPPARKLLYRRGGLSHRLSHTLSHMTNGSPEQTLLIPPALDGHRRSFSEADKRRIVEEAVQPGAHPFRAGASRWDNGACSFTVQIDDASARTPTI
jgi:hypothetical protein